MNEKCSYRCVLLFCISIICSITAIIIRFVDFKSPQISEFGFIGLIATFMGMCATFIVGFQIYNSIEYKSEIRELRKVQGKYENELKDMKKKLEYESNEAYVGIYLVQGITFKDSSPSESLRSFLKSIEHSLNVRDIKRAKVAIRHIESLTKKSNDFNTSLSSVVMKELINKIRMHVNYEFIEEQLDKLLIH